MLAAEVFPRLWDGPIKVTDNVGTAPEDNGYQFGEPIAGKSSLAEDPNREFIPRGWRLRCQASGNTFFAFSTEGGGQRCISHTYHLAFSPSCKGFDSRRTKEFYWWS